MIERTDEAVQNVLDAAPTPLELLRRTAAARPDHPALISMRHPGDLAPQVVRYGQLLREVELAIGAFRAAGVEKDDGIAILLPAGPEAAIAFIAATAAGVAFPVNLLLSSEALATQLTLGRVRVAIVLGDHPALDIRQRLLNAAPHVAGLRTVVEVPIGARSRAMTWTDLLERGRAAAPITAEREKIAALFHTGGTTGEPKLAQLSAHNISVAALMMAAAVEWRAEDRMLGSLPMFHVAGAIDVVLGTIAAGATLIFPGLLGARDPEFVRRVWSLVDETSATLLGLVPTSLAAVIDTPLGNARLDSLRAVVTGGSPLSPQLAARVEALVRRPVCQVYGMTETSGILTAQPTDGNFRAATAGFVAPLITLNVRKPDGSEALVGEVGEICARGPNVFAGYRTHEGTVGCPTDGWVTSGDLGQFCEDGQLRLLGRSKDVIIRSGHNIDPAMIEEAAYAHPDVRQAGAVPMPDEYAGELPVLYVALRDGAHVAPDELSEFVATRIAERPAHPKRVLVLPELPLTPLGKIARFKLRQLTAEWRAREAIGDAPVETIRCLDPTGKRVVLLWRSGFTDREQAGAEAALERLGLTIEPAAELPKVIRN